MRRKQGFQLIKRDSQEEMEGEETTPTQNNLRVIHTNAKSSNEDGPSSPKRWRMPPLPRTKRDKEQHAAAAATERLRRRECSILIELIRTCLATNDIRTHLPAGAKSIHNLSQLDVLEVAANMLPDYIHDMISVRHILCDIEKLSKLGKRANVRNMECMRPRMNYGELHFNIGLLTENAINKDKPVFAKYGKTGPSTTAVAEFYRAQFQHNLQDALELVYTTNPKEFFVVSDRIQSMLDKVHGVGRRQNTDHFEHSSGECTHSRENLPLLDNDFENPCDCPEQTCEYPSTEESLVDQLASDLQCESERPNLNWPEGTQDNEFHFLDSEFTLGPEDIISLEGDERLDQPLTHCLPNEQTAGHCDSTGLSTSTLFERHSRVRKTARAPSNDGELPHTIRKQNLAQALDENGCVSEELSSETLANDDCIGKEHDFVELSENAMKYCQELDAIYGDMPTEDDDNHIDECIQILDEIGSLGCQSHRLVQEEEIEWSDIFEKCPPMGTRNSSNINEDLGNSENDSAVPQNICIWDDTDIGATEVFPTATANSPLHVGTVDELSSFVNNDTEPIDSDSNEGNFADTSIEACISNYDGNNHSDLFEIEISEIEWRDVIGSTTDDTDFLSPSDFHLDLFTP
ncbi:unnamed protein product [Hymenolepis diminuta]|uniref:Uncharacterized protein n=1 Tax=Hymenolepis diminuta TaxID=6216 RepID=A0A564Z4R4_HYMDI|nr:unnamed protein product [Hymenolepis diminuta]